MHFWNKIPIYKYHKQCSYFDHVFIRVIIFMNVFVYHKYRTWSATLSLLTLLHSVNLQHSLHLCSMHQTTLAKRILASCPCRLSPRVSLRAKFLCNSPLTPREHPPCLSGPLWLSRNHLAVFRALQVKHQQRWLLRRGLVFSYFYWTSLSSSSPFLAFPLQCSKCKPVLNVVSVMWCVLFIYCLLSVGTSLGETYWRTGLWEVLAMSSLNVTPFTVQSAQCLVLTISAIPHSIAVSTLMPPLVRRWVMAMRGHMAVKARGKSASTTAGPQELVLGRRRSTGQSLTSSTWVN